MTQPSVTFSSQTGSSASTGPANKTIINISDARDQSAFIPFLLELPDAVLLIAPVIFPPFQKTRPYRLDTSLGQVFKLRERVRVLKKLSFLNRSVDVTKVPPKGLNLNP